MTRNSREEIASIAGNRVHHRWFSPDHGGAPLLFLHEGLGSVELWRDFPAEVARTTRRPALAYSRLGNGWSDLLDEPRRPDYMHQEALETLPVVVDRLIGEPPIMVGHSDGASIALIHAGSGHQVRGLVLIAPHAFVEDRTIEAIRSVRSSFPDSRMGERMGKYHRDPESTFYGWADVWLDPRFRDWNIEEYLGGIDSPSLLIQSRDDPYGTLAQLDAIEQRVSGPVKRLVVHGSDHSPHRAHPREVMAGIADFVSELGGVGP